MMATGGPPPALEPEPCILVPVDPGPEAKLPTLPVNELQPHNYLICIST